MGYTYNPIKMVQYVSQIGNFYITYWSKWEEDHMPLYSVPLLHLNNPENAVATPDIPLYPDEIDKLLIFFRVAKQAPIIFPTDCGSIKFDVIFDDPAANYLEIRVSGYDINPPPVRLRRGLGGGGGSDNGYGYFYWNYGLSYEQVDEMCRLLALFKIAFEKQLDAITDSVMSKKESDGDD